VKTRFTSGGVLVACGTQFTGSSGRGGGEKVKTEGVKMRSQIQPVLGPDEIRRLPGPQQNSKVSNQVSNPNAQNAGKPHEGVDADGLFASLHFANVHGMQVGLLGQPLLGERRPLAVFADGFANKFSLSWRCGHTPLAKQQGNVRKQPLIFPFDLFTTTEG
jgi:hypothetical protein